jgi:DNA-binding MarR family transcriptional regulator
MTTEPDLSAGQVAFLLSQVGAHVAAQFARRLEQLDTTPATAGLLRLLAGNPGMSQQQLASALGTAPSQVVGLIDQLQAAGLAERRPHPTDRRTHAVHLTDAGTRRLREIGRVARDHGKAQLGSLSEAQLRQLGATLTALAEAHGLAENVHPGYQQLRARRARASRSRD